MTRQCALTLEFRRLCGLIAKVACNDGLAPCPLRRRNEKEMNMDFGKALHELKCGRQVAREGWNGKGIFIELQRPNENSIEKDHKLMMKI